MILTRVVSSLAAICIVASLAGCGGGNNESKATPVAAAASPVATSPVATSLAQAAPIPAGLQCTGDVVVWVNLKSKAYHEAGDPFFGRTKIGKYMCKADAVSAGDHAAGAMHGHRRSPAPSATASGY